MRTCSDFPSSFPSPPLSCFLLRTQFPLPPSSERAIDARNPISEKEGNKDPTILLSASVEVYQ